MTPMEFRFVEAICRQADAPNGTQAAIEAGYAEVGAASQASYLLKKPNIRAAIEEQRENIRVRSEITVEAVLRRWWEIANADPNEITQVRRVGCRHCHGVAFAYQWTEAEYMEAVSHAIAKGKEVPDGMGGFGYDRKAPPHKDCPECSGIGQEVMHVADTRHLKGSARKLYAGVQKTKDGIKVLMRDQDAALANVSRYLGMTIDRKEISGPGGAPVALAVTHASELTDDQLAAVVALAVEK